MLMITFTYFNTQTQTNFQMIQIAIVKCYGAMALQQTQFSQFFVYIGGRRMITWEFAIVIGWSWRVISI